MFHLKLNEKDFNVRFVHIGSRDKRPQTLCSVVIDEEIASTGLAQCSTSDNFEKAMGRKIAMARAVERFPLEIRKALWNEYWKRSHPPRRGGGHHGRGDGTA